MFKIIKTKMWNSYMIKFVIRIIIFGGIAALYIIDKPLMYNLMTQSVWKGISPIHVLWLVFMVMMICHIFPAKRLSMALRKVEEEKYSEVKDYSEVELLRFVQTQNTRAWVVMLIWLCFNAIFGVLYLTDIMDEADLLMLTVFYFLCDYICILIYCPFQSLIMKNRCCVNCRIYDWGHFMMFTPMLFIRNFFSWSLFFTACIVLVKWEIVYAKHPERFWYGSNSNLQCANCNDKICQIKNGLKSCVGKLAGKEKGEQEGGKIC